MGTDRANLKLLNYCNRGQSVFYFPRSFLAAWTCWQRVIWNAKEHFLFKDKWVLQFTSLLPDISALWYQLLKLRDIQAPTIWGHPKVHQAPQHATSAEMQQCSGTLTKFAYDKPSISQQIRTSSSHLIPLQQVHEIRAFLNSLSSSYAVVSFLSAAPLREGGAGTWGHRQCEHSGALEATSVVLCVFCC